MNALLPAAPSSQALLQPTCSGTAVTLSTLQPNFLTRLAKIETCINNDLTLALRSC